MIFQAKEKSWDFGASFFIPFKLFGRFEHVQSAGKSETPSAFKQHIFLQLSKDIFFKVHAGVWSFFGD